MPVDSALCAAVADRSHAAGRRNSGAAHDGDAPRGCRYSPNAKGNFEGPRRIAEAHPQTLERHRAARTSRRRRTRRQTAPQRREPTHPSPPRPFQAARRLGLGMAHRAGSSRWSNAKEWSCEEEGGNRILATGVRSSFRGAVEGVVIQQVGVLPEELTVHLGS